MQAPQFLLAILDNERSFPLRQVLGMVRDSGELADALAQALANARK